MDFPIIQHPEKLKVAELKEELERRGLELTGIKKDLVARLIAAQDLSVGGGGELVPPPPEAADEALPPKELGALPPVDISEIKAKQRQSLHGDAGDTSEPMDTEENDAEVVQTDAPPPRDGEKEEEEGAGGVMVQGSPEKISQIRELEADSANLPEEKELEAVQPAALDPEVARIVAEEEMKDDLPVSPAPLRAISPLPVRASPTRSRPATPPPPGIEDGDATPDPGPSTKRALSIEPEVEDEAEAAIPKRPRQEDVLPLPPKLSHLIHPPTATLYITNLRRPLLLSSLHDHLFPDPSQGEGSSSSRLPPPRNPFASADYPNVWVSPIKSHAYALFPSPREAISTAERINGIQWPEDDGAGAGAPEGLGVEFVPDEKVLALVSREEEAWSGQRQKLDLRIWKDESTAEVKFEFEGKGSVIGGRRTAGPLGAGRRGVVAPPLRGGGGVAGAPTGPSSRSSRPAPVPAPAISAPNGNGNGVRPVGRYEPPRQPDRDRERFAQNRPPPGPGNGNGTSNGRAPWSERIKDVGGGRGTAAGEKRTRMRPSLAWSEGPGSGAKAGSR